MRLETDSFIIRPFTAAEIPAFAAYHNDLIWMQYQGFKNLTLSDYKIALLHPEDIIGGQQFALMTVDDKTLLGDIYLKLDGSVMWLGYTIAPMYARKGLMQRALHSLLQQIIHEYPVTTVKAGVLAENSDSKKLLEKLNFKYLGVEDDEEIYQLSLREY